MNKRDFLDRIDDAAGKLPDLPISTFTTATLGFWLYALLPWHAAYMFNVEITVPVAAGLALWTALFAERFALIERTFSLLGRKLRDLDYWLGRQLDKNSEDNEQQGVEIV